MKEIEVLSNRIQNICKERRMTYYVLAYCSTVPLTTIMHIVNGSTKNPGVFTVIRICSGLGIPIPEFFETEDFLNIEFETE